MSFEIIVDSASNLTRDILEKYNIHMISYHATIDGEEFLCYEPQRDYDKAGHEFYEKMRHGALVKTSLVNTAQIEEVLRPMLADGRDIMFIGISSGLSGTVQAARIAAETLSEEYPACKILVIDSMGASLGEGLMAVKMSQLRAEGMDIGAAAAYYEEHKMFMNHIFTVDDLNYLKRGGRISAAEAAIGNLLSIKPVLKASAQGTIVVQEKVRSRKRALDALVRATKEKIRTPENQVVGIAHCDVTKEAEYVANSIKETCGVKDILIRIYDLCTGTHVGPGTIAVFFMGEERV